MAINPRWLCKEQLIQVVPQAESHIFHTMNEFIGDFQYHNLPLSVATVNTVNVFVPDGRSWEGGRI